MSEIADESLRKEAKRRLKAKNDFWIMVVIFAVVTVLLIGIWFFTLGPGSYFWPLWPIIGFVLAAIFTGLDAYGVTRRHISEADIDAEVRKMKGDRT